MSTRRTHPFPKKFTRRTPDELLVEDGVRRLIVFACSANDRHRVMVPDRSLEAVPQGRCPICGGALAFQSTVWEGEIPAEGYDPDAAFEALAGEGYYAWTVGGSQGGPSRTS